MLKQPLCILATHEISKERGIRNIRRLYYKSTDYGNNPENGCKKLFDLYATYFMFDFHINYMATKRHYGGNWCVHAPKWFRRK